MKKIFCLALLLALLLSFASCGLDVVETNYLITESDIIVIYSGEGYDVASLDLSENAGESAYSHVIAKREGEVVFFTFFSNLDDANEFLRKMSGATVSEIYNYKFAEDTKVNSTRYGFMVATYVEKSSLTPLNNILKEIDG